MKQESWLQIVSLIVLAILAIFYNPAAADFQSKVIFFGIVLATALFLVVFDIYKKIEALETDIRLFNEKLSLKDRIQKLEDWKSSFVTLPRNKKGQIDSRFILLVIILILIYLYLKAQR
jgi:hypothetical protein